MIERDHDLPVARQARALNISRGSVYYKPRPVPAADLEIMRRIDELHLDYPLAGSRMLRDMLAREGIQAGASGSRRGVSVTGCFGDVVDGARQRHLMCQDGPVS